MENKNATNYTSNQDQKELLNNQKIFLKHKSPIFIQNKLVSTLSIDTNEPIKNTIETEGTNKRNNLKENQILFENGDNYLGETQNNQAHGFGRIKYKNGDKYRGYFVKNLKEGSGSMTFANGNVYNGSFKNDKFEGQGVFRFVNGNVYKGNHSYIF
jgi:hypothetical protein